MITRGYALLSHPLDPRTAYPPEPDLRRKKVEIKGGLAELQKRGIKITRYTESKG
jgi:hypothetical protein